MRIRGEVAVLLGLGLACSGCGPKKSFEGPTVDAFTGRLTHNGRPVTFPETEKVRLEVYHETGRSFLIPIRPDGSFDIGWMPIGKYSATLLRGTPDGRGPPAKRYNVSGGLTIEDGKTEYTIELGKGWRP
jgi:hypothetical protein